MNKITFVNGSQPAINDTNLNQMQTNIESSINEVDDKIKTNLVSNQEIDTGKNYHGKKVYKKEILINTINQSSLNEFNHGIQNLDEIMSVQGIAYTSEREKKTFAKCIYIEFRYLYYECIRDIF